MGEITTNFEDKVKQEVQLQMATFIAIYKNNEVRNRQKEEQGDQTFKNKKLREDREGTTSTEPTVVERQWLQQKKVNSELSDKIEDNKKSVANLEIKQKAESTIQQVAGGIQTFILERQNEVIIRQDNTEQRLNQVEMGLNHVEQRQDNTEERQDNTEQRQNNTEQRVNHQDETITNLDQVGFSTKLIYNLKPLI